MNDEDVDACNLERKRSLSKQFLARPKVKIKAELLVEPKTQKLSRILLHPSMVSRRIILCFKKRM